MLPGLRSYPAQVIHFKVDQPEFEPGSQDQCASIKPSYSSCSCLQKIMPTFNRCVLFLVRFIEMLNVTENHILFYRNIRIPYCLVFVLFCVPSFVPGS